MKEIKNTVRALKNEKTTGLGKATGEMIKKEDHWVCNWLCRSCNVAFESRKGPED